MFHRICWVSPVSSITTSDQSSCSSSPSVLRESSPTSASPPLELGEQIELAEMGLTRTPPGSPAPNPHNTRSTNPSQFHQLGNSDRQILVQAATPNAQSSNHSQILVGLGGSTQNQGSQESLHGANHSLQPPGPVQRHSSLLSNLSQTSSLSLGPPIYPADKGKQIMELLLNKLSSTYEYNYAAISKDLTHLGKVTPIQTQTDLFDKCVNLIYETLKTKPFWSMVEPRIHVLLHST